jgi:hypothetical protein
VTPFKRLSWFWIGSTVAQEKLIGNIRKLRFRLKFPVSPQSLSCAGEGRNGRGLVVLDVEEAVHLGDLEQVADPPVEVHQL